MDLKTESLPLIAVFIVIAFMTYTNVIIIHDVGRVLSILPISLVIIIWCAAILKLRRAEDVR
jgi:hypothetical protein